MRYHGDEVTNNQVAQGAVVTGGLVQTGSFTGQVHFHYHDRNQPMDLLTLRGWIDRIAADYRVLAAKDQADAVHAKQVDSVLAGLDDSADENKQRDIVRRLLVAGVTGYLSRASQAPAQPLPEQILLDLVVSALWPVVTARRLPRNWQGELAEITSPRLAALVERTRRTRAGAEELARAIAKRSLVPAMAALFDDLADARRGGALLMSMAVVTGLPRPSAGHSRKVLTWVVGIAGGAAALAVVTDRESAVRQLYEKAVTDLPEGDELEVTELLVEVITGLFE